MKLSEIIKVVLLMPKSGKHMLFIHQQLQIQPYDKLIKQAYHAKPSKASMIVLVKSYFWASRLLKKCSCLPRSIAIYQHLTTAGFKVEHKFGVNKNKKVISAHAWVEFESKPLNEAPDLNKKFTPLE